MTRRFPALIVLLLGFTGLVCTVTARVQTNPFSPCAHGATDSCYFSLALGDPASVLHYYASLPPGAADNPGPTRALVAMHGHSRDANKTFDAASKAMAGAGALADTLIVAPLFQVEPSRAGRCETAGVPSPASGDLLWTCGSWLEGAPAVNGNRTTSFAALDALLREIARQWPSVRTITLAGFSAGAQVVQHYVGFAAAPAAGAPAVRYVIADPGSWLYFDAQRPQLQRGGQPAGWADCGATGDPLANCQLAMREPTPDCARGNAWKYGTDDLPASLGRSAAEARAAYATADISYIEGELDSNAARGTADRVLDRSCAAMAQGPFRLQRGLAYSFYDRTLLAPVKRRSVTVVPGCAHDVACVFPSPAARAVLLGSTPEPR